MWDFVVRRAFRSANRAVVRQDLIDAFLLHPNIASAVLTQAVDAYPAWLQRVGYRVRPIVAAPPPPIADEADLADALRCSDLRFERTGLRADELPVNQIRWASVLPTGPGALMCITSALVSRKAVDICYVSMREGDHGQWRRIVPLSIDDVNGQCRVYAHDLTKAERGDECRSFVLSRVIDARVCTDPLPKGFVRGSAKDSPLALKIALNDRLTAEQRIVLMNELSASGRGGLVGLEIDSRTEHDFRFRYSEPKVAPDVIWPPVVSIEKP